jgi:long-chain acyl-CoA synthetase
VRIHGCKHNRRANRAPRRHKNEQSPLAFRLPARRAGEIDTSGYPSLVQLLEESFGKYADRTAYSFMGKDVSYRQTDSPQPCLRRLPPGAGPGQGRPGRHHDAQRAAVPGGGGRHPARRLVVVNVNPLYTPRELEHQLKDSGAKAIVIIENFASTLQQCIAATPVKHVVLCAMGDQLGLLKGALVNYVVRNVKKMVPAFNLPGARALQRRRGPGHADDAQAGGDRPDDVAVLQYTGGTTGVSKGAVLLHRNVIANVLQSEAWNAPVHGQGAGRPAAHRRLRAAAVPHLRVHVSA